MEQDGPSNLVIDVTGLVKKYAEKVVVDQVSLKVKKGEICGFLGPNGSGKTTTIRLMCGLLSPDAGQGSVLGYDLLTEQNQIKQEVGYMTQRFSLYEDLSISQNLLFVARLYNLVPAVSHVQQTLIELGLESRKDQLAGTLSGGWKQRLALAACIMHKPKLLMLDEPTAGVDPKARREFWDEIHRLSTQGLTVLVSTHYMDEAERCHSIHYIANGKLKASGTVEQVIKLAGLTTYVMTGKNLPEAVELLKSYPCVLQIAPFGLNLHVVGNDPDGLASAVDQVSQLTGCHAHLGETSLEDVFIQFMDKAKDSAR